MTRILIVDDHEVVRAGVRTLVQQQTGFEVIGEAADGNEAVHKALELSPDIVILDIGLPSLNGLTAAEAIKDFLPETRVVFFTMFDSPGIATTAKTLGFDGFVSKAEGGKALMTAVAKARRPGPAQLEDAATDT